MERGRGGGREELVGSDPRPIAIPTKVLRIVMPLVHILVVLYPHRNSKTCQRQTQTLTYGFGFCPNQTNVAS